MILAEECEACQEGYLSQLDHQCCHYGNTQLGSVRAILRHYREATDRLIINDVKKIIVKTATICGINVEHLSVFGVMILSDLLDMWYFRWLECKEDCLRTLSDTLSVSMMSLCNEIIDES